MIISSAIEQYKVNQRAKTLSPNTLRASDVALENLLKWSRSANLGTVGELSNSALDQFAVWLQEDCRLAASTATTRLKYVKSFLTWLETEGHGTAAKVTLPKQPRHGLPDVLSDHEIELVKAQISEWQGPRLKYKVMILFLIATGLRIHEVLKITVGELDCVQGQATIKGKGGRVRTIAWAPKGLAGKVINKFVKGRESWELVFAGPNGNELSQDAVQKILSELGRVIDTELSAHKLRRTWCSQQVAAGVPVHIVQRLGGWADLTIVSKYLHLADYQQVAIAQRLARI